MKFKLRTLLVAAIVGINTAAVVAVLLFWANPVEEEVIRISHDVIQQDAESLATEITDFLAPAQQATSVTAGLIGTGALTLDDQAAFAQHLFAVLAEHPGLDGYHYGTEDGSFVFVFRDASRSPGGYQTRVIRTEPERIVTVSWHDASFRVLATETDSSDTYDPRVRDWYIGARDSGESIWADPYVFFLSREPGITTASPVMGEDSVVGVVGADVYLAGLSKFLEGTKTSPNSVAYIISIEREILVYPGAGVVIADGDEIDFVTEVPEVAAASFARFRNLAPDQSNLVLHETDDERYHSHFVGIDELDLGWTVAVQIPESDYVAGLDQLVRRNLLLTVLIGLIATVLGVLLAGRVSDPIETLRNDVVALAGGEPRPGPAVQTRIRELDTASVSVTEARQQIEHRIRTQTEAEIRAIAANKAKTEFLAAVSHELRTPLTVIIGFTSMLESEQQALSDLEKTEQLGLIRHSADHLLQLINDILDVAKIESGEFSLDESEVTVSDEVEAVMRMMGPRARTKELVFENLVSDSLVVRCDARRLRQMLLNLTSNAVKFSNSAGEISIRSEVTSNGAVVFELRDQGIGMSDAEIRVALQQFGQVAQGVGNNEGTGLGLPLTRHLAESHGGRLWITSVRGEGTSVFVELPADRVVRP